MPTRTPRSTRVALALAAGATLLLSACGGSDTAESEALPVIENVDAGADSSEVTAPAADVPDDEAVLEWAACMRDNGVDIEDPTVDADGNIQLGAPGGDFDPQSADFQSAAESCGALLEGTTFSGANRGVDGLQEGLVAFTTCLRDEGLDVGDVDFSGGQPAGGAPDAGSDESLIDRLATVIPGFDPADPSTEQAVATCEPILNDVFNDVGIGG